MNTYYESLQIPVDVIDAVNVIQKYCQLKDRKENCKTCLNALIVKVIDTAIQKHSLKQYENLTNEQVIKHIFGSEITLKMMEYSELPIEWWNAYYNIPSPNNQSENKE